MEAGCCPEPEGDDGTQTRRHLIYARHFKTARDDEGNHASAGILREAPWIAVPQVVASLLTGKSRPDLMTRSTVVAGYPYASDVSCGTLGA